MLSCPAPLVTSYTVRPCSTEQRTPSAPGHVAYRAVVAEVCSSKQIPKGASQCRAHALQRGFIHTDSRSGRFGRSSMSILGDCVPHCTPRRDAFGNRAKKRTAELRHYRGRQRNVRQEATKGTLKLRPSWRSRVVGSAGILEKKEAGQTLPS